MSFKVSVKKTVTIWGKIRNLMNKEFDSGPAYGESDKYI